MGIKSDTTSLNKINLLPTRAKVNYIFLTRNNMGIAFELLYV